MVEIALGAAFVALPRHQRLVGGLLAAFFVAIFPGNVAQYVEGVDAFGLDTDRARLVRLFFQPVLVLWALWGGGWLARRRPAPSSRARRGRDRGVSRSTRTGAPGLSAEIRVLLVAAFLIAVGFGLVSPVLPAYARSFDVGVAAASVVVSAFAFFRLVFAPVGGALVQRLGERPVYLVGLLVVAASSLATAFAQSYAQLLVLRGLGGIGSTMFTVSAMALLVRLAPPHMRGRVSSAYASAFLVGGMIGPGARRRARRLRPADALRRLRRRAGARGRARRRAPRRHPPAPRDDRRARRSPMRVREALGHRAYVAALGSGFANGWCNFGVRVAVLPQLAIAVHDDTWVAGVALALAAAGTAATLQVSGRLADSLGRRPLVVGGLVVTAVSLGPLGLSHSLVVLFALSVLSGVGAGMVNPAQQSSVADVIGSGRSGGTVLSTFQMSQDAGAILGPVLVGLVADAAGFGWAFATTALVSLLAVPLWLAAPETRPTHRAAGLRSQRVGSQSTRPASAAYPTKAPTSSSVWATTNGMTRPQRRKSQPKSRPIARLPTKPPSPW